MEKRQILDELEKLKCNPAIADETKEAAVAAQKIVKKARTTEQLAKAHELLLRLLGIGSNLL